MLRTSSLTPTFVLGLLISCVEGQNTNPPGRAYKVAFWYDIDRPTTTLQYRAYDLAKGQYNEKAVNHWFRTILENHPSHGAYIRDIRTEGELGTTEAERLTHAIDREKQRWADLNRMPSKPFPRLIETSATFHRSAPPSREIPSRTSFDRPAPGSPGVIAKPPASPFPYPYRSGLR